MGTGKGLEGPATASGGGGPGMMEGFREGIREVVIHVTSLLREEGWSWCLGLAGWSS